MTMVLRSLRALRRYPPRRYDLDDYKRWFPSTGTAFLRCLKNPDLRSLHNGAGGEVGVVIGPWVSTPVPWYGIMLGLGLARRGRNVSLLWDDTGFPERHVDDQNKVIGRVLATVNRVLPVSRLSDEVGGREARDSATVASLADQNVIWRFRGGTPRGARQQRIAEDIRQSLHRSHPLICRFVDKAALDCLVLPGGVYGTSGLFLHEARARGIRTATFDTDRRVAQICVDGVAAQNEDIPRAFEAAWTGGGDSRDHAIQSARAELASRIARRDNYGFQALASDGSASQSGSSATSEGGVLIPLNVVWDTAALGRHVHFTDTIDWVSSTVAFILERDAGPVIVRQHPSERRKLQRSNLDVASALREQFGDDPRCQFVAADDPISSYDLIRDCRLVLPYVSTIAIEAAAMGKPVLISGRCYYSELGFVHTGRSREEYFSLLQRGLDGDLLVLPDQSDRAWVCYYLAAVQNRVATDFTPHPNDFWSWCRRTPQSLFDDPQVSDILEAIDRDVPVSLLRHQHAGAG